MKHRFFSVAIVLCLALVFAVSSLQSQNKRTGTAAATELLIPVGGRDLAMGGASLATTSGIDAMYWNPAGLGRMKTSAEGMFSSMTYIADIGVSYGAVAGSFGGFGVLGLSIKSLDFGYIPLTTEDDPETESNRFFAPSFVTVGLSYSRSITDAISFGLSLKIISEHFERVSGNGFALDFGVQYDGVAGISGFAFGLAVKNIGPQMSFDGPGLYRLATARDGRPEQRYKIAGAAFELPSTIEIGLSYSGATQNNIGYSVSGGFLNNNLYLDEFRLGGEVSYTMEDIQLFGRAGLATVTQAEEKSDIFGPTFGAGFTYNAAGMGITLDYAYRSVEFFDANNVFAVKLAF